MTAAASNACQAYPEAMHAVLAFLRDYAEVHVSSLGVSERALSVGCACVCGCVRSYRRAFFLRWLRVSQFCNTFLASLLSPPESTSTIQMTQTNPDTPRHTPTHTHTHPDTPRHTHM